LRSIFSLLAKKNVFIFLKGKIKFVSKAYILNLITKGWVVGKWYTMKRNDGMR